MWSWIKGKHGDSRPGRENPDEQTPTRGADLDADGVSRPEMTRHHRRPLAEPELPGVDENEGKEKHGGEKLEASCRRLAGAWSAGLPRLAG